jgi:hypothetical protein
MMNVHFWKGKMRAFCKKPKATLNGMKNEKIEIDSIHSTTHFQFDSLKMKRKKVKSVKERKQNLTAVKFLKRSSSLLRFAVLEST